MLDSPGRSAFTPVAAVSQAHARLIRQLELIAFLTEDDKAHIAATPLQVASAAASREIVRQHDRLTTCCLIVDGLAYRYKSVADGRRQILSLHYPGDLPDLHGMDLERIDYSIGTLPACQVAFIPHAALRLLSGASPTLANAFRRYELVDGSTLREWVANLGRRDAAARIGHLFCEVSLKMRALGLADGEAFRLPLTQVDLADTTGLSAVHVNRTLQYLRARGLIESHGQLHTIRNRAELERISDFDPSYLHLRTARPDLAARPASPAEDSFPAC